MRYGSTTAIVLECGATSSARPPVATTGASTPSSPRIAVTMPSTWPGEAVDDAGLEPADGRLPDHARRLDVVDLDEPRRTREERLHRGLDSRREHAADVLARRRDDVEVRRGAEVDDDHGSAVALLRGDRVDDPVGTDLARVVVADRDPGLDARPDDEDRRLRPAGRRAAPTRGPASARSTRGRSRRRPRGRACRRAARRARHPSACARSRGASRPSAARRRRDRARSACCRRRRRAASEIVGRPLRLGRPGTPRPTGFARRPAAARRSARRATPP